MPAANAIVPPKGPKERIASPVKRVKIDRVNRPDLQEIIEKHKPDKALIERIKKSDPNHPFYLTVTPEIALTLLTLNEVGRNRHIKWWKIDLYMAECNAGEWADRNGETYKISREMKLLDSQHRLWAFYLSGTTHDCLIVTGIDPRYYSKMDLHAPRSASDVISIGGHQTYSEQLAYAIKSIILFDKRSLFKGAVQGADVFNHEVDVWQQDEGRMKWMVDMLVHAKKTWMADTTKDFFTAPQWVAIFYILKTLPGREKDAKAFLDSFTSGAKLDPTSPIMVLRKYFVKAFENVTKYKKRNKISGGKLTMKVKYVFAAWDLWLEGASVSQITVDLESSPVVKKPNFKKKG